MPKIEIGSALNKKTGEATVIVRVEGTAYFTLSQAAELIREIEH
jgi:hypothetical protein